MISILLSSIDIIRFSTRLVTYVRSGEKFKLRTFWNTVVRGVDEQSARGDYSGVKPEEPEQYSLVESRRQSSDCTFSQSDEDVHNTSEWANDVHRHHRRSYSHASESTLVFPLRNKFALKRPSYKVPRARTVGRIAFATAERALVFLGFMQFVSGIVTYTGVCPLPLLVHKVLMTSLQGGCRENYLNGCLAHLISK